MKLLSWAAFLLRRVRPQGLERPAVFKYRTANGVVGHWDAVQVRRRLETHGGADWGRACDAVFQAYKPAPEGFSDEAKRQLAATRDEARRVLAELVAKAFDVRPMDRGGLGWSEEERLSLMAAFLNWCADILEATRPFATPPASTDSDAGG